MRRSLTLLSIALTGLSFVACSRRSVSHTQPAVVTGSEASSATTLVSEDAQSSADVFVSSVVDQGMDASSARADATIDSSADGSSDAASSAVARACSRDDECVLVTGGCMGPMAAHREQSAEIDARNQRLLSIGSCDGRFVARPVRASCVDQRCALVPLDHVEWRSCQSTRECTPVHRFCQRFEAVSRRFEREARDAMNLSQPCGPVVIPPAPRIECRYGWCVTGWAGR
ncbi:MAG: hypothetical protein JNK05_35535 [Myxococcales bacterium]|nr:hypothetical protein [Myxococcales bacterium]